MSSNKINNAGAPEAGVQAETPSNFIDPHDYCSNCKAKESDDFKLTICGICFGDAYCGRDCQVATWKIHQERYTDVGVWNMLEAIERNDLVRVRNLSATPQVVNGESKRLGRGGGFLPPTRPLMACVRFDNIEAMRILLESGNATKIDICDGDGDTALHMAAGKSSNGVEMMNLLMQFSFGQYPVCIGLGRDRGPVDCHPTSQHDERRKTRKLLPAF